MTVTLPIFFLLIFLPYFANASYIMYHFVESLVFLWRLRNCSVHTYFLALALNLSLSFRETVAIIQKFTLHISDSIHAKYNVYRVY